MNEHTGMYGVPSFFPTPREVVLKMLEKVTIEPGDNVIEPSAGMGHIARVIEELYLESPVYCIEKDPLLRAYLLAEGHALIWDDIFTWSGQMLYRHAWNNGVDVIVANPPFSNNYQDIDHFCRYWELLNYGSQIVCLVHAYSAYSPSSNPAYKPNIFWNWCEKVGIRREMLPANSFAFGEFATQADIAMIWGTKR